MPIIWETDRFSSRFISPDYAIGTQQWKWVRRRKTSVCNLGHTAQTRKAKRHHNHPWWHNCAWSDHNEIGSQTQSVLFKEMIINTSTSYESNINNNWKHNQINHIHDRILNRTRILAIIPTRFVLLLLHPIPDRHHCTWFQFPED